MIKILILISIVIIGIVYDTYKRNKSNGDIRSGKQSLKKERFTRI